MLTPAGCSDSGLTHSPLVQQLIADLLPRVGPALVIGQHSSQVISAVSSRLDDVTVLVATGGAGLLSAGGLRVLQGRRVGQQETLTELLGRTSFQLVVAAEGLDDALARDSNVTWEARLSVVAGLLRPGGCLVVGGRSDRTLLGLVPGQPKPESCDRSSIAGTHGSRPATPAEAHRAFAAAGLAETVVHCLFGEVSHPRCIVDDETASEAQAGELVTAFVQDAVVSDVSTPGREAVGVIAEAGALPLLSCGWLAVTGGSGRPIYAEMEPGVLVAGQAEPPSRWRFERLGGSPARWLDAPRDPDVETQLRRALDSDDLTAFRSVARTFGAWVRALDPTRLEAGVAFDGLYREGSVFTRVYGAGKDLPVDVTTPDETITAAWVRFAERLGSSRVTSVGPSVGMYSKDRLVLWLAMSEVSDADGALAGIRRVMPKTVATAVVPEVVSPREQLEQQELIRVLHHAVELRNSQLGHREDRLRRLGHQLVEALRERDDALRIAAGLRRSREYRVGRRLELLRDPNQLAGVLAERAARIGRRAMLHLPRKPLLRG